MRKYNKYEAGMEYGKLTLVKRAENPRIWECRCECGATVFTQIAQGSRACRKCAHERISKERTMHGESNNKSRLYNIWIGIKTRCYNKNHHSYKQYGARGIGMCKDWKEDYVSFKKWAEEYGYEDDLEIDRKDYEGDYEPSNCQWTTRKEQMRNTSRNRRIEIDGHNLTFAEWLDVIGMKKQNVYKNAKKQNMTVEAYLTKKYYDRNIAKKME